MKKLIYFISVLILLVGVGGVSAEKNWIDPVLPGQAMEGNCFRGVCSVNFGGGGVHVIGDCLRDGSGGETCTPQAGKVACPDEFGIIRLSEGIRGTDQDKAKCIWGDTRVLDCNNEPDHPKCPEFNVEPYKIGVACYEGNVNDIPFDGQCNNLEEDEECKVCGSLSLDKQACCNPEAECYAVSDGVAWTEARCCQANDPSENYEVCYGEGEYKKTGICCNGNTPFCGELNADGSPTCSVCEIGSELDSCTTEDGNCWQKGVNIGFEGATAPLGWLWDGMRWVGENTYDGARHLGAITFCKKKPKDCDKSYCDPDEPCPLGQDEKCCLEGRGCVEKNNGDEGSVCCPKNEETGLVAEYCGNGLAFPNDKCCSVKEQEITRADWIRFFPGGKPLFITRTEVRNSCTNDYNVHLRTGFSSYNQCCSIETEEGCGDDCCSYDSEFCVRELPNRKGETVPVSPHCCPRGSTGCGDTSCCKENELCCFNYFLFFGYPPEIQFDWPLRINGPDLLPRQCVSYKQASFIALKTAIQSAVTGGVAAVDSATLASQIYCLVPLHKIPQITAYCTLHPNRKCLEYIDRIMPGNSHIPTS